MMIKGIMDCLYRIAYQDGTTGVGIMRRQNSVPFTLAEAETRENHQKYTPITTVEFFTIEGGVRYE